MKFNELRAQSLPWCAQSSSLIFYKNRLSHSFDGGKHKRKNHQIIQSSKRKMNLRMEYWNLQKSLRKSKSLNYFLPLAKSLYFFAFELKIYQIRWYSQKIKLPNL